MAEGWAIQPVRIEEEFIRVGTKVERQEVRQAMRGEVKTGKREVEKGKKKMGNWKECKDMIKEGKLRILEKKVIETERKGRIYKEFEDSRR